MRKGLFFAALSGLALLASCTKELEPQQAEYATPAGPAVTLTVTTAEPQSKTYMEQSGGAFAPRWSASDKIGVFLDSWSSGTQAAHGTLSNTLPDGPVGSFSGVVNATAGTHTLYAFYPSRAFFSAESGSVLRLEIPYIQFPSEGTFDPRADVLVSVPQSVSVSGSSASADALRMRRVGAILEVVLLDQTGILSGDRLKSLRIEAPGSALAGAFRYDFSAGDAASEPMSGSRDNVSADFSEAPVAPGSKVYLIVSPGSIAAGTSVKVTAVSDRHEVVKTFSLPSDLELPSSKVTTLSITLDSSCTVSDILYSDSFDWIFRYWDGMADGAADSFLYTTAHDRVQYNLDPVGSKSTSTSAAPVYKQPNIWAWNASGLGAAFTALGYADRQQHEAAKVLYAQENYLKFGKTNYHNCLTLPAMSGVSGSVNVDLSFDWSVQDTGKEFVVEITGGGTCSDTGLAVSAPFSQASKLTWERKTLLLRGITSASRITVRPNVSSYSVSGVYRWFIDNIRVSVHEGPAVSGNVYGRVLDGSGHPVEGVPVSDGYVVVTTDADGWYGLQSDKAHGYVFISQPQGYEVPLSGVFPQFWQALGSDAGVRERHDFTLNAVDNSDCVLLALGDFHLCNRNALHDLQQFRLQTDELKKRVLSIRSQGKKVYGLTLGDMTWDLYWDNSSGLAGCNFDLAAYKSEVNTDFAGLSFPIWHTIGNHDHDYRGTGDWDTVIPYKQIIGPTYYSFNVGGYHIISLDNVICNNDGTVAGRADTGGLTQDILDWITADLARVDESVPLIISLHEPIHTPYNPTGGYIYNTYVNKLYPILGDHNVHIVSGHTHCVANVKVSDKVFEHNTGALCSTWWWTGRFSISKEASWGDGSSLATIYNVGRDGSPAGYTVYDLASGSMKWRYKGFGLDDDCQFKTYDRNEFTLTAANWCPAASATNKTEFENIAANGDGQYSYAVPAGTSGVPENLVYINVWNYDTSTKIKVTENGKSLTVTKLVDAYDPMHMVAYQAVRYQNGSGATSAFVTGTNQHMFRVQASSPTSTLEITVTDRFGNVSTQTMTRPKTFTVDWN